jgi:hypothetical protein
MNQGTNSKELILQKEDNFKKIHLKLEVRKFF